MKSLWNGWKFDAAGIAIAAACTVLGLWLGVGAALERRARSAGLEQERDALADERIEARQTADELTSSIEAARAELDRTEITLRPESDLNTIFADLGSLAQRFAISVDQLEPGTSTDARLFRVVPLRFVGRGEFPDIAAFMRSATTESPDLAIRSFSIAAAPASGGASARFEIEFAWRAVSDGAR